METAGGLFGDRPPAVKCGHRHLTNSGAGVHPHRAGAVGPRQRGDDDDLHPRAQPRRSGRPQPGRPARAGVRPSRLGQPTGVVVLARWANQHGATRWRVAVEVVRMGAVRADVWGESEEEYLLLRWVGGAWQLVEGG